MTRTEIWKETIGKYKDKYVCQIWDDHDVIEIVSGDTYEEVSKKVMEKLYGKR